MWRSPARGGARAGALNWEQSSSVHVPPDKTRVAEEEALRVPQGGTEVQE